jgi:hypothetical protein
MLMPFAFQQSGAVVFDPASISGLTHRYSASGAASGLSGSFVTSWTDAVSGVNMVQSTAGRQPIYIASSYDFNGQPVVRFSSGKVLASTSLSSVFGSANRTVFVIAKTNATGDVTYGDNLFATDDAPIASYNSNTWPYYLPKAISTRGIHGWASASSFYGEQPVSKPITIVWRQNSGTITFRREQTTLINAAFSVSGNQGYCVAGKGMQNTGHDSDCDISEILVYNRALSDAEITQVENYAIARYNLGSYGTLPVTGAALWLDASRSDTLYTDNALTTAATTDNGPIGGWRDLSGNNRHAMQTGTNRPTWRTPINGLNGLGAMSFNGATQFFAVSNTIGWGLVYSGNFTISFIHKVSSVTGGILISHDNGPGVVPKWTIGYGSNGIVGSGFIGLHYNGGVDLANAGTGSAATIVAATVKVTWTPTVGQTYQITVARSGNNHLIYVDGVQVGSTQVSTVRPGNPTVNASVGWAEGASATFIGGSIAETLVYLSGLNATQLASVKSYLSAKWGTP